MKYLNRCHYCNRFFDSDYDRHKYCSDQCRYLAMSEPYEMKRAEKRRVYEKTFRPIKGEI
jgi:hypothetical protein